MTPGTRIPLASPMTSYDRLCELGFKADAMKAAGKGVEEIVVWAEATGEFRPPQPGEWYVSGATPEAYQMPEPGPAFDNPYFIARLRWEGDYPFDVGDELVAAAMAVVERWNTPLWKDVPHTALYIQRLERAAEEFETRASRHE